MYYTIVISSVVGVTSTIMVPSASSLEEHEVLGQSELITDPLA